MALKQWLAATGACFALLTSMPECFAQQWPERTVRIVVPYGAGGVTDTMARVTADRLGKILNQTFIVENKPGAGGAIGVDYAISFTAGWVHTSVCRKHAVHRSPAGAGGELRAFEGSRARQYNGQQWHDTCGRKRRAILDVA